MREPDVDGIATAIVIAVATLVVGTVACVEGPANTRKASILSGQLQIESRVRSFDFLRPGEVAVDVLIKNVGRSAMILDFRRDRRPRKSGSGIVQPHSVLDLLTFRPIGMTGLIAKEKRTSNERRHRDSLNEGALLESLVELLPLLPGQTTGAPAIIWSESPQTALGSTIRELEVEFRGLVLTAAREEVEIKEHFLFGTTLLNKEKWESKEYSEVSVVGRFPLVQ